MNAKVGQIARELDMTIKRNTKARRARPTRVARKKAASKKKPAKKTAPLKANAISTILKKYTAGGSAESMTTEVIEPKKPAARSGGQAGDLQGLSDVARIDSESVDELIEEGNAFEAEVVQGIEDAPDADEGEIVDGEVPEDNVPGEHSEEDL